MINYIILHAQLNVFRELYLKLEIFLYEFQTLFS